MRIYNEIPGNNNEKWMRAVVLRAMHEAKKEGILNAEKVVLTDYQEVDGSGEIFLEVDGVRDVWKVRTKFLSHEIYKDEFELQCNKSWSYDLRRNMKGKTKYTWIYGVYDYIWKNNLEDAATQESIRKVVEGVLKKHRICIPKAEGAISECENSIVTVKTPFQTCVFEFKKYMTGKSKKGSEMQEYFEYVLNQKFNNGKSEYHSGRVRLGEDIKIVFGI